MIAFPKKEIWVSLKNTYPLELHLTFPKDYFTTNDMWNNFSENNGLLIAYPKGETTTNWNKYFGMYYVSIPSNEVFAINDAVFNINGYKMINMHTEIFNDQSFIKYMEYLDPKDTPYFEYSIYFDTVDNGSFLCFYVEKLHTLLNDQEFTDKISEDLNEILPCKIDFISFNPADH